MNKCSFETDITAAVENLKRQAGETWRVPETLMARTVELYKEQAQRVRDYFLEINTGVNLSDVNVLLEDYARALFGVYDFTATREQMQILSAVRSANLLMIDRYGLYYAVLGDYRDTIKRLEEYDNLTAEPAKYRGAAAQVDEQRAFINGPTYLHDGRAVLYLIQQGEFDAGLFATVAGPAEVNEFIGRCRELLEVYQYAVYYTICKKTLLATPDELAKIPTPKCYDDAEKAREIAEFMESEISDALNRTTKFYSREIEKIKRQQEEKQDIIKLSPVLTQLQSRAVLFNKQGAAQPQSESDLLPIKLAINEYVNNPSVTGTTTPLIVQKTFGGVDLLHNTKKVEPVGDWYTYNTTKTEFARLCGYDSPNADEINAIITALTILKNLYVAVWTPRGWKAVQPFTVPEIGMTGQIEGKLKIQINVNATKGKPILLTRAVYERLRREAKGVAARNLMHQIIGKGHKKESDLLNEVFEYDAAIREAQEMGATPEQVEEKRRNIQKNKARDRKKMQQWFIKQQKAGTLTFETYTNDKGETVYKWQMTNPKQA